MQPSVDEVREYLVRLEQMSAYFQERLPTISEFNRGAKESCQLLIGIIDGNENYKNAFNIANNLADKMKEADDASI